VTSNGTTDPDTTNNTSNEVETTVQTRADISVTKTGPNTAVSGDEFDYTIVLTNGGPSDAQSVALSDTLPAGTTFVSLSQSGGNTFSCTTPPVGSGGTVSCTRATLAAGASQTFTLRVAVVYPLDAGTVLANTATGASATQDPSATNNSSTNETTVAARVIGSTSQLTNSAFKLVDDLSPWAVPDFEILLNGQNTIVATNPGQFYYHQRATNTFPSTTHFDFTLNWPCQFTTQTTSGQAIHAYVQYATDPANYWRPWTDIANVAWTNTPFSSCSQVVGPTFGTPSGTGTISVQNVPVGATVWVNVHLDYAAKGLNISSVTPDPMKKPVTYGPFSSTIVVRDKATNFVVGSSYSGATVIGRGKKVTMVYGRALDHTGAPLAGVWVQLKQGTSNTALTVTEADGSYLFYDDQGCTGTIGAPVDGLYGCTGTWLTAGKLTSGNGNVSTTVTFLGNGTLPSGTMEFPAAYSKAGVYTATQPTALATISSPSYVLTVSRGSAYHRNFKFNN
jgi:uncharacterized repeat protein (TIGR01451 family)